MGFVRDWLRRRDEARLKKLAEARLAETRKMADAIKNDPRYALDGDHSPGEVTAQIAGATDALDEVKQAKADARSSAQRVLAVAKRFGKK